MKTIIMLNDVTDVFKADVFENLAEELTEAGFELIFPKDSDDLLDLLRKNARIGGVIFDWDHHNLVLSRAISKINGKLPVFTFINDNTILDFAFSDLAVNIHFHNYVLNHVTDIVERVELKIEEYINDLLPTFTKALFDYVRKEKYTFCTPGHMGGAAFEQSPVGSLFYDFYGENAMRSDVSISVEELGSLLDHSGPHKEAEEFIEEVFNADRSFIVTNGTSTANKIVGMYACPAGSTILVDRNCHKSITHLMMMTNLVPIYLRPTRNAYGILGGIPKHEFTETHIQHLVDETPKATWPTHAVITNSTYDGLFYNTDYIKKTLPVNSIHFDSAWVPYTNFHPIYDGKSGMGGDRVEGKVIYETQSTHKLLAAFSQSSMIHVKGQINEHTFNEGYMMHTTTSPLYSIVASCETAAAMMQGESGKNLMQKAIDRAINFRKEIIRLKSEAPDWFFDIWQPDAIEQAECWPLNPHDEWHGFSKTDHDHLYLDPIKVTVLMPGMDAQGKLDATGIPGLVVARFLDERGIIIEKTGPYTLLFLFSMGIDETRSLTLLRTLMDFKRIYDANLTIRDAMPGLYAVNPEFYVDMRIQDLAQGIHQLMIKYDLPNLMYEAFDHLPKMEMTPHEAYQEEIKGNVTECLLSEMVDKVSANMILPYPPGVPLIMPGEKITKDNLPILRFLEMLCERGKHYPGFETDIHGIYKNADGQYTVRILQ